MTGWEFVKTVIAGIVVAVLTIVVCVRDFINATEQTSGPATDKGFEAWIDHVVTRLGEWSNT